MTYMLLALLIILAIHVYRRVCVPRHLRHIPKVPLLPLLFSYISGEVEERRIRRVILPFAQKVNTDVVLVFTLGEWMVHILDAKVTSSHVYRTKYLEIIDREASHGKQDGSKARTERRHVTLEAHRASECLHDRRGSLETPFEDNS